MFQRTITRKPMKMQKETFAHEEWNVFFVKWARVKINEISFLICEWSLSDYKSDNAC